MKEIIRLDGVNLFDFLSENNKTVPWKDAIVIVEALPQVINIMESSIEACYQSKDWSRGLLEIIDQHNRIAKQLFAEDHVIFDELNDLFVEIEWQLEEEPEANRDYFTDQVLTVASVLSSNILFHYLNMFTSCNYLDTRDIIVTDNKYGRGNIDVLATKDKILKQKELFESNSILILPADIASSTENYGVRIENGLLDSIINDVLHL